MSAQSYPIQLNLAGRPVLVAGAGRVATRKIERLVASRAQVSVVSVTASGAVQQLAREGQVGLALREVRPEDVRGQFLVIAATDDVAVNANLASAARAAGALVSRVDAPEDSDFSAPAVARCSYVQATVSTHGAAPSAARRLSRELQRWLQQGPDRFAAELGNMRRALRGRPDANARLHSLAEGELFDACVAADEARIRDLVQAALRSEEPA